MQGIISFFGATINLSMVEGKLFTLARLRLEQCRVRRRRLQESYRGIGGMFRFSCLYSASSREDDDDPSP
jgi:hypothetical protein